MKNFIYYKDINTLKATGCVVELSSCINTKKDLIQELSEKLNFPKYFSYNWDSLYDFLRDFSWINSKDIYIIHKEIPKLNNDDLKIYLEVLIDSLEDWLDDSEHDLYIFFSELDKEKINNLLRI